MTESMTGTRYDFDDAPGRIDRDVVWRFMTEQAYWGKWRDREVLDRQIDASWRTIGCYDDAGRMVGFARAVSDSISFAYLADVFVLPGHRGRGLGVALVKAMIDDGPGAHFRWMLHTADAHELYADFGFAPPNASYLERPASPERARLVEGTS